MVDILEQKKLIVHKRMPRSYSSICLFASEMGTLLGLNKFKTVQDGIQTVLLRIAPSEADPVFVKHKDLIETTLAHDKEVTDVMEMCKIDNETQKETIKNLEVLQKDRMEVFAEKLKQVEQEDITDEEKTAKKRKLTTDKTTLGEVIQQAKSKVNCQVGTHAEEKHVAHHNIRNTQKGFSKYILDLDIVLYGKVDGFDDELNQVVEIKTRQNRLWRRFWPSELVQAYCYMFLTGASSVKLIEKCGEHTYEEVFSFDAALWEEWMSELKTVCAEISVLRNHSAACNRTKK